MAAHDDPAVWVDRFSFRYGDRQPIRLREVDLRVGWGEWVAVIGPSGGGKSTLALAMNAIIPHEFEGCQVAGRVLVAGRDTRSVRPQDLVAVIGTVLQDPEWQLTRPTVEDEIAFGLENLGVPRDEIGRRIDEVLRAFGLEAVRARAPEDLSGGEKQRVAIAAAFALRPGVLLLDEPLSELDPLGKEQLLDTVQALRRRYGATVVFIDHNVELVVPLADRVVVVSGGRVSADTTPRRLMSEAKVLTEIGFEPPLVTQAFRIAWPSLPPDAAPLTAEDGAALVEGRAGRWSPRSDRPAPHGRACVATGHAGGGMPLLSLRSVSYGYGGAGRPAVRGVSLDLWPGTFVSLIGANGAGKSTLARLAAGLLAPANGEVAYRGVPLSRLSRAAAVRAVGYVFQNPDFQFFNPTVRRELTFALELQKMPRRAAERRAEEVAEALGLTPYLDEHPHFLSRGERRRVAIAAMVALGPELLILDEPTAGLDQATVRRMTELVLDLKRMGHAVLLVTHEMRLVAEASDRVVVLKDGEVWMDGPPQAVFDRAEELRTAGVVLPPIMELGRRLRHLGAPITVDPKRMAAWLATCVPVGSP